MPLYKCCLRFFPAKNPPFQEWSISTLPFALGPQKWIYIVRISFPEKSIGELFGFLRIFSSKIMPRSGGHFRLLAFRAASQSHKSWMLFARRVVHLHMDRSFLGRNLIRLKWRVLDSETHPEKKNTYRSTEVYKIYTVETTTSTSFHCNNNRNSVANKCSSTDSVLNIIFSLKKSLE